MGNVLTRFIEHLSGVDLRNDDEMIGKFHEATDEHDREIDRGLLELRTAERFGTIRDTIREAVSDDK